MMMHETIGWSRLSMLSFSTWYPARSDPLSISYGNREIEKLCIALSEDEGNLSSPSTIGLPENFQSASKPAPAILPYLFIEGDFSLVSNWYRVAHLRNAPFQPVSLGCPIYSGRYENGARLMGW